MKSSERGMTLVELLVIVCIVVVLMTIGAVQLVRARTRGYEASAVASLRLIVAGQVAYSVSCGNGGFAPTLPVLSRTAPRLTEPFVPAELSSAAVTKKSQYLFTVHPASNAVPYRVDCYGTVNTTAFVATARPEDYGISGGTLSFATLADGKIWSIAAAVPPAEPFGPPATPLP